MRSPILIILLILLSVLFNFLIIKYKNFFFKLYPTYNPTIQKTHEGYSPPLGGILIFLFSYTAIYLISPQSFLLNPYIFIPSLAIILVGLIEDLFGKTPPMIRLSTIFISSLFFCIYTNNLPNLEIYLIGDLINNNSFLKILFFSICITGISNGLNILDGMNGLSGFTCISILISILLIFAGTNLSGSLNDIYILLIFIIIFIIFNFPYGKIFLGDAGAYWLGWVLSVIIIEIYSNNEINTWGAAIILIYPGMEVITSTVRKIFNKKNPFFPDPNHIHLKLHNLIKGEDINKTHYNYKTTIYLIPIWFSSVIFTYLSQKIDFVSDLFLFALSALAYLIFFILVPKSKS